MVDLVREGVPMTWGLILMLFFMLGMSLIIIFKLGRQLLSIRSRFKSKYLSTLTRHGQLAEQFMPFSRQFPGDPKNFRFLGSPVDGVSFEDDRVLIVEFKTGQSKLSERQKHIRNLVKAGKVEFKEVRLGA